MGGRCLTWNLVNVRGNTLVGDQINMWFIAVSLLPSLALETERQPEVALGQALG